MKVRKPYDLPPEQQRERDRAKRLEWTTIGYQVSVVVLLAFVLGQSQAMKAAWADDLLSLIPPIAFLVAVRIERKPPNERFPYGFYRTISIGFLCASLALFAVGAFLFVDSVIKLATAEHPSIGTVIIFGWQVWLGWVMIAALVYSIIPAFVLGRKKLPVAERLHDKVLYADADMNKADWMSEVAAMVGILGIGFGLWWADAAAGALISLNILRDGWKNLSQVIKDLVDEVPTKVGRDEPDPLPKRLKGALEELDWVEEAEVRLREEGHVFTGEGFVVPKDQTDLVAKIEQATRQMEEVDWRLHDFHVIPVRSVHTSPVGE